MADKRRTTGRAWLQDVFQQDAKLAREAIRLALQASPWDECERVRSSALLNALAGLHLELHSVH